MTEQNCGVYKIENTANGKLYIGSSSSITERITRHKYMLNGNSHPNKHLQSAWNKYGESSFIFNALLFCNREELPEFEEVAINAVKSFDSGFGYNKTKKANFVPEIIGSVREKIGKRSKENWKNPDYRKKVILGVKRGNNKPENIKIKREKKEYQWQNMSEEERNNFINRTIQSEKARKAREEHRKYPFNILEVEEEITIKVESISNLRAAASIYGRINNKKLKISKVDNTTAKIMRTK